jgi:hypothetical protein
MEMDGVEEGILVVAINGAHCGHSLIDGLATDDSSQQVFDALCCCCGPDGERESDYVCREYRAVVDDRSSESSAFACREHEEFAAIRRTQRDDLGRPDISVIVQGKVVLPLKFIVVPVSRDDHDMRPEGADLHLQASCG